MVYILLLTLLVSILLAITGELSPIVAGGLILGCLFSLGAIFWKSLQQQRRLSHRQRQSNASWGSTALHLGGFPVPLETPGLILLSEHKLIFESDHLNQNFELDQILSILCLPAEQLRHLSDAKICAMLGSARCQSLANARERVRKGDNRLKKSILLLIHHHEEWQTQNAMSIVILALNRRTAHIDALAKHSMIRPLLKSSRLSKRPSVFSQDTATDSKKDPTKVE